MQGTAEAWPGRVHQFRPHPKIAPLQGLRTGWRAWAAFYGPPPLCLPPCPSRSAPFSRILLFLVEGVISSQQTPTVFLLRFSFSLLFWVGVGSAATQCFRAHPCINGPERQLPRPHNHNHTHDYHEVRHFRLPPEAGRTSPSLRHSPAHRRSCGPKAPKGNTGTDNNNTASGPPRRLLAAPPHPTTRSRFVRFSAPAA